MDEPLPLPTPPPATPAKNTVWIYINGILAIPGEAFAWTDRAVFWTHINTPDRGEKFEYAAGVVSRRWFHKQEKRAAHLLKVSDVYRAKGWIVNWVAHSNGADVVCRALQLPVDDTNDYRISSVTLIAPACEADMMRNGLNTALEDGVIGRFSCHWGSEDTAMKLAKFSLQFLKLVGLGYGNMGSEGPKRIGMELLDNVTVKRWVGYGHSTFFEDDEKLELIMREIHR